MNINQVMEGGYATGVCVLGDEDEDEVYSLSQAYDIPTDLSSSSSDGDDEDDSCEEGDFHTPSSRAEDGRIYIDSRYNIHFSN